jgi:hypothetical protein
MVVLVVMRTRPKPTISLSVGGDQQTHGFGYGTINRNLEKFSRLDAYIINWKISCMSHIIKENHNVFKIEVHKNL